MLLFTDLADPILMRKLSAIDDNDHVLGLDLMVRSNQLSGAQYSDVYRPSQLEPNLHWTGLCAFSICPCAIPGPVCSRNC